VAMGVLCTIAMRTALYLDTKVFEARGWLTGCVAVGGRAGRQAARQPGREHLKIQLDPIEPIADMYCSRGDRPTTLLIFFLLAYIRLPGRQHAVGQDDSCLSSSSSSSPQLMPLERGGR
jgi:hypothetical protein